MKNQPPKIENTFAGYEEMEESLFLEKGTIIFKKYKIIRLLGHGGMGQVYLAKDLQLGRLVAVKTLSIENNYSITQAQQVINEYIGNVVNFDKSELEKERKLNFPLIQVPISHVVRVSSPVNPNNIFLRN